MKGIVRIVTIITVLCSGIMYGCNRKAVGVVTIPLHDSSATTVNSLYSCEDITGTPDSAYIKAFLRCDSLGNVYLNTIEQLQGSIVSQSISLTDNNLSVEAKSKIREKTETIKKDSVRTVYVEKAVPYPVETITNRLTSWQSYQIWTGRIALIAIIVFVLLKFFGDKISSVLNIIKKLFK